MIDDISPPGSWAKELAARPHTISDVWQALRDAESALARAEADAARYRWLKANATDVKAPGWHVVSVTRNCLDATIDAARGAP